MPTILAIETSSELASCALLRGGAAPDLTRDSSGVRTHSQAMLPMVQSLLAEAGIALADCDAIAYGSGPGSFTGVRTACGIAQGLAFGAGLPVVPVVTLEAMALACRQRTGAAAVLAVLDARMGEVYWAEYRFDDAAPGVPHTVLAPALSTPEEVAPSLAAAASFAACGNGLAAYAGAFAAQPWAAKGEPEIMPHALQVAQLAQAALSGGAAGAVVTAAEAQPLYLRNKIAFTSAERRDMQAAKAAADADAAAAAAATAGTSAAAGSGA